MRSQRDLGKLSIKRPTEGRQPRMLAVGAVHAGSRQVMPPYKGRGPAICGRKNQDITPICRKGDVRGLPVVSEQEPTPSVIQGLRHILIVHVEDRTTFV